VDHRTAKADAERIEHHISDASLEKLVPFARKTTTPAQTAKLKDG
jgi:Mn-dependent DtxR family transcriptional regulator